MKKELLELFLEIIGEWETAEEIVINDRGIEEEYEELELRKAKYTERLNCILNKLDNENL